MKAFHETRPVSNSSTYQLLFDPSRVFHTICVIDGSLLQLRRACSIRHNSGSCVILGELSCPLFIDKLLKRAYFFPRGRKNILLDCVDVKVLCCCPKLVSEVA